MYTCSFLSAFVFYLTCFSLGWNVSNEREILRQNFFSAEVCNAHFECYLFILRFNRCMLLLDYYFFLMSVFGTKKRIMNNASLYLTCVRYHTYFFKYVCSFTIVSWMTVSVNRFFSRIFFAYAHINKPGKFSFLFFFNFFFFLWSARELLFFLLACEMKSTRDHLNILVG